MVDMSQIIDDVLLETACPLDLFGVLTIEMVEHVQLVLAPRLFTIVAHDDDVFEGIINPIVVESKHVDPPLSFDVLLGFVLCTDYVLALSSYMDMIFFKYSLVSRDDDFSLFALSLPTSHVYDIDDESMQHDSNEDFFSSFDSSLIDQKVSPTTGDAEIVDFDTVDQSRELMIVLDLSTDERDSLVQLLRSSLDVFAWSYEDMLGLDPSIVQHHLPLLSHARPVKLKLK